jgi:hypothetical protein
MISHALKKTHSDIGKKQETATERSSMYWVTAHAKEGEKAKTEQIIGFS